ncbi:28673_t:CDS:1, partial [Gigaspora margarita]
HMELNINGSSIKLQNSNLEKLKPPKLLDSIVHTCNELLISHNGYYQLVAIISKMECEYKVDKN